MNLDQIPTSDFVMLDANILIYAVLQKSVQCMRLLRRCTEAEVFGVVGLPQLAEVMHRLMMLEARDNDWISGANPVKKLVERPDRVRLLTRYSEAVKGLLACGIRFEPIESGDFSTALSLQKQCGFLTNDALLLAVADRLRIHAIASADSAMAVAPGIMFYTPDDLP